MAPKDDAPVATLLETEEQWKKISGEEAEKDFLNVVEVFASWCGPSEAIISTLKRVQMDLPGRKLKFYKVRHTPPLLRMLHQTQSSLLGATRTG